MQRGGKLVTYGAVPRGDLERARSMADRIEAGAVGVTFNDNIKLQAPFGGWKMSGMGRELMPKGTGLIANRSLLECGFETASSDQFSREKRKNQVGVYVVPAFFGRRT